MKHQLLFIKFVAIVAALMCALGASAAEAYANYTPSNTTLTFYYDNNRASRTGTTYDLNTLGHIPDWISDTINYKVTAVVFDPSFAGATPTVTHFWFFEMQDLKSITGLSYLNTSQVTNMSNMFYNCVDLTTLDLSTFNTANVTDMNYMFKSCKGLKSLDLTSFSTAKVTRMDNMFYDCTGLTTLDLSSFNTAKVTRMDNMFIYCTRLTTIYVGSYWNTEAVVNSDGMFINCVNLVGGMGTTYDANYLDKTYAHIDGGPSNPGYFTAATEAYACYMYSTLTFYYDNLRNKRQGATYDLNTGSNDASWDTAGINVYANKVVFDPSFADYRPTTTYDWFYNMKNLNTIEGIEYLNTSEVTNMAFMFDGCNKLTSLDLSGFITNKVTNMTAMFRNCTKLQTIYVGNGWSTNAVTQSVNMFWGCTSLAGGQGTTYNSSHDNAQYAHIDGGPSNPGYFTAPPEAYACIDPSYTTLTFYYDSQRIIRDGERYSLNTGSNDPGWYEDSYSYEITKVVFDPSFAGARPTSTYNWFAEMYELTSIEGMQYLNTSEVTNMASMFWECGALTAVDVSGFDTHKVTDMSAMFSQCYELTALDVSGWNTSNVTDMSWMFDNCSGLTSLDVSHFNTANVTNMYAMFDGCSGLSSLDVSNFDTGKVTDMAYMFNYCSGLTALDVSGFNTSNVTKMYCMFMNCSGLTSLDVSSFNTAKVTSMNSMFYDCSGLTSLDLSNFNTAKVTDMYNMFYSSENLRTIYVGDGWSTAVVTNSTKMFYGCTSLVGGMGTTYDANNTDAGYACIDGGPDNPGYFTSGVKYNPVMLPANENYIGLTSFRADWIDETLEAKVASYTLLVNPKIDEPILLHSLDGTIYTGSYADITLPAPWGGVNVRGGQGAIYVKNNYNGNARGYITYTIPEGYVNATFSLLITTGSGSYAAGNYTVYTPQTAAVGHNFVAEETYTWLVTASTGEKITIYSTDSGASADIALMSVYAVGNAAGQLISDITDKFYTVKNLEAGGTYQYRVKALYTDGTESGWSNAEEVTLSENTQFLRGDVNGDGNVNTGDLSALISLLLGGGDLPDSADCNQDGNKNVGDVPALINFLLTGSW